MSFPEVYLLTLAGITSAILGIYWIAGKVCNWWEQ